MQKKNKKNLKITVHLRILGISKLALVWGITRFIWIALGLGLYSFLHIIAKGLHLLEFVIVSLSL